MEKFDTEKWRLQGKDKDNISECMKCGKSYYYPLFRTDQEEPRDPRRSQLQVCRVCFYEINQNLTPEMELLFKLVDKQSELYAIQDEFNKTYLALIEEQRTPARVELDKYQKAQDYVIFGGPQPRPEGFVGDPPLEKCNVVFGVQLVPVKVRKERK